ncbi:hypothetical protein SNEBB_000942 [Seison nebaliae]|nr:hypothetical protein SNEBB_000942 [Seison nebaliae]
MKTFHFLLFFQLLLYVCSLDLVKRRKRSFSSLAAFLPNVLDSVRDLIPGRSPAQDEVNERTNEIMERKKKSKKPINIIVAPVMKGEDDDNVVQQNYVTSFDDYDRKESKEWQRPLFHSNKGRSRFTRMKNNSQVETCATTRPKNYLVREQTERYLKDPDRIETYIEDDRCGTQVSKNKSIKLKQNNLSKWQLLQNKFNLKEFRREFAPHIKTNNYAVNTRHRTMKNKSCREDTSKKKTHKEQLDSKHQLSWQRPLYLPPHLLQKSNHSTTSINQNSSTIDINSNQPENQEHVDNMQTIRQMKKKKSKKNNDPRTTNIDAASEFRRSISVDEYHSEQLSGNETDEGNSVISNQCQHKTIKSKKKGDRFVVTKYAKRRDIIHCKDDVPTGFRYDLTTGNKTKIYDEKNGIVVKRNVVVSNEATNNEIRNDSELNNRSFSKEDGNVMGETLAAITSTKSLNTSRTSYSNCCVSVDTIDGCISFPQNHDMTTELKDIKRYSVTPRNCSNYMGSQCSGVTSNSMKTVENSNENFITKSLIIPTITTTLITTNSSLSRINQLDKILEKENDGKGRKYNDDDIYSCRDESLKDSESNQNKSNNYDTLSLNEQKTNMTMEKIGKNSMKLRSFRKSVSKMKKNFNSPITPPVTPTGTEKKTFPEKEKKTSDIVPYPNPKNSSIRKYFKKRTKRQLKNKNRTIIDNKGMLTSNLDISSSPPTATDQQSTEEKDEMKSLDRLMNETKFNFKLTEANDGENVMKEDPFISSPHPETSSIFANDYEEESNNDDINNSEISNNSVVYNEIKNNNSNNICNNQNMNNNNNIIHDNLPSSYVGKSLNRNNRKMNPHKNYRQPAARAKEFIQRPFLNSSTTTEDEILPISTHQLPVIYTDEELIAEFNEIDEKEIDRAVLENIRSSSSSSTRSTSSSLSSLSNESEEVAKIKRKWFENTINDIKDSMFGDTKTNYSISINDYSGNKLPSPTNSEVQSTDDLLDKNEIVKIGEKTVIRQGSFISKSDDEETVVIQQAKLTKINSIKKNGNKYFGGEKLVNINVFKKVPIGTTTTSKKSVQSSTDSFAVISSDEI